ncbi:hypothetical protein B296_00017867 [Ensete ventricosum]|uniref:Uncharacterized protein n=1 Tax=Ensete ventricosum TaxID=4639 RepID=A0A427ALN0_ENSVE|nr:hypothetical protein B296_00017867 [Ensete ventricosum]
MTEELERDSSFRRTKYLRIPNLPSSASSPQHRPLPPSSSSPPCGDRRMGSPDRDFALLIGS